MYRVVAVRPNRMLHRGVDRWDPISVGAIRRILAFADEEGWIRDGKATFRENTRVQDGTPPE